MQNDLMPDHWLQNCKPCLLVVVLQVSITKVLTNFKLPLSGLHAELVSRMLNSQTWRLQVCIAVSNFIIILLSKQVLYSRLSM